MKYGIREICDVVFKATVDGQRVGRTTFKKGEPVLYFDTLKTSSLEQATTTVYATGGRGNTRLMAWDGEKQITWTMEDALISEVTLAILAGAGLYADDGAADELLVHVTEKIVAGTTNNVSKAATTKTGVKFFAVPLGADGDIDGTPVDITISDKKITGTLTAGTTYIIDYYIDGASGTKQIDIEPQSFGGNFYIEADTLFRDQFGKDYSAQFIIPNGKIQSNFTLSMASSGDPSTFTFTVDAFPGYVNGDKVKKVLSAIQILGDSDTSVILDPAGDKGTVYSGD